MDVPHRSGGGEQPRSVRQAWRTQSAAARTSIYRIALEVLLHLGRQAQARQPRGHLLDAPAVQRRLCRLFAQLFAHGGGSGGKRRRALQAAPG